MGEEGNDTHVHIGTRADWGSESVFGLDIRDRRQAVYIIGKSGTGKTTLLKNLILQDAIADRGVAVIDPHGDLSRELIDELPKRRAEDILYFNPADVDFPIGFNPLTSGQRDQWHLITSGIVTAFKQIWRESWGPRLEYLLSNCVAALLWAEGTTLLGIPRLLTDATYRTWVVKQVKDPLVKAFWTREFAGYDKRLLAEIISPLQNKVGTLLLSPALRNCLGQVRNRIDFRFLMDHRKIFIANLSKGLIGEESCNLLGSLLVSGFQIAALGRASLPEHGREDFPLLIDEVHSFTTDSFTTLLSEARKYRLCLTLAHQYSSQLAEPVRNAIFGNVGSLIAFRVGHSDANILASTFGDLYPPSTFTELDNHEVCVKLLHHGKDQVPFRGRTLPPLQCREGGADKVIRRSRERFATLRSKIEGKLGRWL